MNECMSCGGKNGRYPLAEYVFRGNAVVVCDYCVHALGFAVDIFEEGTG